MTTAFTREKDSPETIDVRQVLFGIVICVLFSVLAVIVRGVRWDETYEHAQVLTGAVHYPEGHPLLLYTRAAFSAQTYVSAGLLAGGATADLVCGLRNVLFLLATILPVYCFVISATRRSLWACCASLLLLSGIFLEFDGSYPSAIWPQIFSNGPIGGGYALIGLWAIATGRARTAAFLVGLMPAVHIGQLPILLATFALYSLREFWLHRNSAFKKLALPFAAGLLICGLLFMMQSSLRVNPPDEGFYAVAGDPTPIWKSFTANRDPHRQFPPMNGHIVLVGALILSSLATLTTEDASRQRLYFWVTTYLAGTAIVVWGLMAVHAWLGADMPFLFIGWMPYRLINHVPPLVLILIVGALFHSRARLHPYILPLALIVATTLPYAGTIVPEAIYTRFLSHGDGIAFALYGAALVALLHEPHRSFWGIGAAFVFATLLAPFHQFGAAAILGGGAAAFCATRFTRETMKVAHPPVHFGSSLVALSLILILGQQWQHRQWLPKSSFDREVARYLSEHNAGEAMVAARPDAYYLQARINHPVLVDVTMPSLISYVPDLGPAIQAIHNDLYGITFHPDGDKTDTRRSWKDLWKGRSAEEWEALGKRYGFEYVIAPSDAPLVLEPIVRGEADALYRVFDAPARLSRDLEGNEAS